MISPYKKFCCPGVSCDKCQMYVNYLGKLARSILFNLKSLLQLHIVYRAILINRDLGYCFFSGNFPQSPALLDVLSTLDYPYGSLENSSPIIIILGDDAMLYYMRIHWVFKRYGSCLQGLPKRAKEEDDK